MAAPVAAAAARAAAGASTAAPTAAAGASTVGASTARIPAPAAPQGPPASELPPQTPPTRPRPPGWANDGAGFLLGLVVYALVLNYLKGGPDRVKGWIAAKFINKPYAARRVGRIPNPRAPAPANSGADQ